MKKTILAMILLAVAIVFAVGMASCSNLLERLEEDGEVATGSDNTGSGITGEGSSTPITPTSPDDSDTSEENTPVVVNIGDIAYSDGTVSASYDSTKKPVGIVFEVVDGYVTKIVSLDQGNSLQWSTEEVVTNAKSLTDGKANLEIIKGIEGWKDKYPAFKWCDEYTDESNNSDWYLPAKDELNQVYLAKKAINEAIEKITSAGGSATLLGDDDDWYWSSSEISDSGAWNQRFSGGSQYDSGKYGTDSVRAVRAFNN